jgi:hypothetical protein
MAMNVKPFRGLPKYFPNQKQKVVCRNFRHTTFTLKKLKLDKSEIPIYLTNQNFIAILIPFYFILYHAPTRTNKKPTNLLHSRKQFGASR